MVGKFAKSKAGHDKNQIYVILKEDAEYVYLVDGKLKTIEKPKKKKKKHIQIILKEDENVSNKLKQDEMLINEEIKVAIKRAFDGKWGSYVKSRCYWNRRNSSWKTS